METMLEKVNKVGPHLSEASVGVSPILATPAAFVAGVVAGGRAWARAAAMSWVEPGSTSETQTG